MSLILAEGVEILKNLPRTILSVDDYAVTGYTLKQELQVLITVLLENDFSLEEVERLLKIVSPNGLSNGYGSK